MFDYKQVILEINYLPNVHDRSGSSRRGIMPFFVLIQVY